jgi:hypothetical protein
MWWNYWIARSKSESQLVEIGARGLRFKSGSKAAAKVQINVRRLDSGSHAVP